MVPDSPVVFEERVDAMDAVLGELFSLLPPTLLGKEGTPKFFLVSFSKGLRNYLWWHQQGILKARGISSPPAGENKK